MNLRNKKLVMTLRIIFGLFMIFSGVSGLMMGGSTEGVPPNMIPIMNAFLNSGIFHLAKIVEISIGLMLIFNFLPALAALFLVPMAAGITLINITLSPETLPMALLVIVFTIYFLVVYWDKYKPIFRK